MRKPNKDGKFEKFIFQTWVLCLCGIKHCRNSGLTGNDTIPRFLQERHGHNNEKIYLKAQSYRNLLSFIDPFAVADK